MVEYNVQQCTVNFSTEVCYGFINLTSTFNVLIKVRYKIDTGDTTVMKQIGFLMFNILSNETNENQNCFEVSKSEWLCIFLLLFLGNNQEVQVRMLTGDRSFTHVGIANGYNHYEISAENPHKAKNRSTIRPSCSTLWRLLKELNISLQRYLLGCVHIDAVLTIARTYKQPSCL